MKNINWLILFLIISCYSCHKKNTYILNEEEFIDILVDIHIADAFYSNNQYGVLKLSEIDSAVYYKAIFEKHEIEKARFDSTLKAYTIQPDVMESIYDKIIDRLKKLEEEQRKKEEEVAKEKDK